ncbi:uncharacterized protein PV09_07460 [Verruconis gallopava]|uniref:Endo-1,3(4)-beta-glucanase 1 carbohydrate binding domain-containing protein n=1 Tax=Verruconis gallopava TaxID=253628 RepID=A0A0D1XG57_9PEZI|nr:uncharacterized protein PV09_07460 [Verruconis gallopava]KIW01176.1 hypothetical protein PV09_07460 [Verruconis gallopava]
MTFSKYLCTLVKLLFFKRHLESSYGFQDMCVYKMVFMKKLLALFSLLWTYVQCWPQRDPGPLQVCGDAFYQKSEYTCYEGDFLCPVIDGAPTLPCGQDCYNSSMYSCIGGRLTLIQTKSDHSCDNSSNQFHISQPPYDNYFYSDCHTAAQVVVSSPVNGSNLTLISPRLIVAWPGGNSGIAAFWKPENGVNGTLKIELDNQTSSTGALSPIYNSTGKSSYPTVGISGFLKFNSTAVLSVAILGGIRTIRDFTEGPSILVPEIQNATKYDLIDNGTLILQRLWLDNLTTTSLSFTPLLPGSISLSGNVATFEAGRYLFTATYDYPQLSQLSAKEALRNASWDLITQDPDQTSSLSFFSYKSKLLAGAWRFLTYFGRDSMLTLLLMQPVLSEGEGGAIEAVIASVLERINRTDGSACHEETIGDYATYLNEKDNITSTQPQCDYKMIDTDYYLPVLIKNYFVDTPTGVNRSTPFFQTMATSDFGNGNLTYADLALINAEKIMNTSAAFAADGGQVRENLIHLKAGQLVGQWRDSTYGIGGGRVPFDVNTALVPAALRSISTLASHGYFPTHPEWNRTAALYAQTWEDETLQFFEISIPREDAIDLVQNYTTQSNFSGPSNTGNITTTVNFYGLALDGNNNQSLVKVMNTDDCFRHFLLNTTNQTQLSRFLSSTADHVLQPFPVGLSTPVGLLIANPAYGGDPVYAQNFTNNAYQGTVVWSWQMAMMAAGLERQLYRCRESADLPDFCADIPLRTKISTAYNHLWDLIEANKDQLSEEMWTWVYENDEFVLTQLGDLPPAPGATYTESDVRQLWSLTFLSVTRNKNLT